MAISFAQQVGKIAAASKERMVAVYRQSIQDISIRAQTPVAKGGRMRVDTGFLRNSAVAKLNMTPSGPSQKPKEYSAPTFWNADNISVTINKAQLNDTVILGWTANYAIYREAKDAFARTAALRWPTRVRQNAKKLEQMIKP